MNKRQRWVLINASIFAKLIYFFSRFFNFGEGSNIPGKIILSLFPKIMDILLPRFKNGLILISGTNGKTTTTKILTDLLEGVNYTVITNARGANLITGIITSILLKRQRSNQEFIADYGIFEIDEAVLIKFFSLIRPKILVVTNFSRDQLDRYGEIDTNVNHIMDLVKNCDYECKLVMNGNDSNIARIGSVVKPENRIYFGIKDEEVSPADGILLEKDIGKDLDPASATPELDLWAAEIQTDFLHGACFELGYKQQTYNLHLKLPGIFNILNALAATAVYIAIGGADLKPITERLNNVKPSYGRSESFVYKGAPVFLFLVKNPVGFNHIIHLLIQAKYNKRIMFLLNDLTADGTDVSWIWDVALENLWQVSGIKEIVASGTRAGDMALRVKYSNAPPIPLVVNYSPRRAFNELCRHLQEGEELLILANYTAMTHFRPYLLEICK